MEDTRTGKQQSLRTRDRQEAALLVQARNEAARNPQLNLALARVYLTAHDPRMGERTWSDVIEELCSHGQSVTQHRYRRAFAQKAFASLYRRRVVETSAEDFLGVLKQGGPTTRHFLRRLHYQALNLGWIAWPVLAPNAWPRRSTNPRRALTAEEHAQIIAHESRADRRRYYELLWETGAAQTDAALLQAENIDWENHTLTFRRRKTGQTARLKIGPHLEALLRQLPAAGPLFPGLCRLKASDRASEFRRRCRQLAIDSISLHSYRFAWAQRAKRMAYPERWAQSALGHASRAVHENYAAAAVVVCPSLEEFEARIVPLPTIESA